jgi:SAM-dependent MidA family methyltransferase
MRSVSSMLAGGSGAAIWLDYGFAAHEYYLDQRRAGTLMCHYRHHAHAEPFYLPGLQDITAHVDFSSMAKIALESGLELLSYSHQAGFLLDAGMAQLLQELDPQDVKTYLPQTNAVNKLLAPHEMGELFKVLVLGRNVHLPASWGRFARQARL